MLVTALAVTQQWVVPVDEVHIVSHQQCTVVTWVGAALAIAAFEGALFACFLCRTRTPIVASAMISAVSTAQTAPAVQLIVAIIAVATSVASIVSIMSVASIMSIVLVGNFLPR